MRSVNILDAKTNLSRLLESLESGKEDEIIIARHGHPVARLIPVVKGQTKDRIGIASGKFIVPESIDADNAEILALFQGNDHATSP